MILSIVFYSFVVCAVIQIIYYIFFSRFLLKEKKEKINSIENPISVLIFVKNQADNLQKFLPSILEQEYSNFEIVLINNASTDNTDQILDDLKTKHANIKVVNVENNEAFWANKKYALTLGIKAAKYEHLLFTNANCKPVSKYWITEMNNKFTTERTIVLGYSKFKREKSFLNIFIRFENLLNAIQCFTYTKHGTSYSAFANNMAYKRSDFFKANGYINHMKIKNGEADLFIKDVSNSKNTTFCISENSFIESNGSKSFKEWFLQKRELKFIKTKYAFRHRFLLNLFNTTKLFFITLAVILFCYYPYKIVLSIVLTYYLVQYIIIAVSAKKLKEPQIIFFLPFLEIGLLLIQISIFSANFISKPNNWK
jgi:glycosyltransferase involved in cell wall biosynthesis